MAIPRRVRSALLPLVMGVLRCIPRARSGALIVPPAGPGSLGDEAMCEGVACALRRAGIGPVTLLARDGHAPWPELAGVDVFASPPTTKAARTMWLLRLMSSVEHVFVVGADCVDGHYSVGLSVQLIDLVDLGQRLGAQGTLLGCSYKPGARPETARALSEVHRSARLCSRDPVSCNRMCEASGRNIALVADPAFMLEPVPIEDDDARLYAWIDRESDRAVVGVNFNHQVLKGAPQSEVDRLFDAYALAIEELHELDGVRVLIVPHDYRQIPNDHTYGERLLERLRPKLGADIEMLHGRRTPGEIKHVAGHLDVVLTGRMHFAVASLGRATPPACVTYQGKFEGLMRHFGLKNMTIEPRDAMNHAALAALVRSVLERRDELRASIESGLPSLRALSFENLPEPISQRAQVSDARSAHAEVSALPAAQPAGTGE